MNSLTPQPVSTLDDIAGEDGIFSIIAMDQRNTLRRMFAAIGIEATDDDMRTSKADVARRTGRCWSSHARARRAVEELIVLQHCRAAGDRGEGTSLGATSKRRRPATRRRPPASPGSPPATVRASPGPGLGPGALAALGASPWGMAAWCAKEAAAAAALRPP